MADRISQAKSASGRETSFGLPTSGFKGWMPVMFKDGTHGTRAPAEGWKNVVTNQEFIHPDGWDGEPPGPTGELITRHASDAYCRGYDQIKWDTPGPKEPGVIKDPLVYHAKKFVGH